jgi:hypothetical protein
MYDCKRQVSHVLAEFIIKLFLHYRTLAYRYLMAV